MGALDNFVDVKGPSREPEADAPGTIIIDFSQISLSVIFTTYSPNEIKPDAEESPDLLVKHAILASLKQNIKRFQDQGYDEIVIAIDSASGGYWRRDIASCYKRNRKKGREESPWDFKEIYRIMDDLIQEMTDNFPWKIIRVPRTEADDIIGVLTGHLVEQGRRVLIISSDSDFTQLHDMGDVSQWSPMQKKMVQSKHGDSWSDLVVKIAKGDAKDNIGPYRCPVDHFEKGERAPQTTKKHLQALTEDWKSTVTEEDRERWAENMQLLDLRRVPEPYNSQILEAYQTTTPARSRVYNYLARQKMVKLISDVEAFEVRP